MDVMKYFKIICTSTANLKKKKSKPIALTSKQISDKNENTNFKEETEDEETFIIEGFSETLLHGWGYFANASGWTEFDTDF